MNKKLEKGNPKTEVESVVQNLQKLLVRVKTDVKTDRNLKLEISDKKDSSPIKLKVPDIHDSPRYVPEFRQPPEPAMLSDQKEIERKVA